MHVEKETVFQFAGVAAVVGVWGAAWMVHGSCRYEVLFADPFRLYPFDPVAAENFQQKLFIPGASGPFAVLDAVGPLKIRAAASFFLLPDRRIAIPAVQTEHAGKAYQNPLLRIESGTRFSASLDNALPEPTIIHWHGRPPPRRVIRPTLFP